jgi:HlyD family secretion protein
LCLSLAGVAACKSGSAQQPKFDTAPVERGSLLSRVTASGTLSALVTVQVGSQVSGRIQKLLVDYNTVVKKGQLLAVLDPQLFEAAVNQSRANLASARANVAKAEVEVRQTQRQLARMRSLAEQKLISESDLDVAQSAADTAQAQAESARAIVLQAQASLHQAQINLQYTSIYSPIDGVVISRSVDVGQTVAASLQAPTLFTIAEDLRKMQVDTSVAEADIGKLTASQSASFTVDAFPGERFRGKVRQIRNAPQTVQNVVTYNVIIDVENPELKLRPGMTANVEVVADSRDEALKVANAAFRFRPPAELVGDKKGKPEKGEATTFKSKPEDPSQKTVWVLRNDKPEPVKLKTGITDGKFTEVVDGELREGDQIITAYNSPDKKAGTGAPSGMSRRPF